MLPSPVTAFKFIFIFFGTWDVVCWHLRAVWLPWLPPGTGESTRPPVTSQAGVQGGLMTAWLASEQASLRLPALPLDPLTQSNPRRQRAQGLSCEPCPRDTIKRPAEVLQSPPWGQLLPHLKQGPAPPPGATVAGHWPGGRSHSGCSQVSMMTVLSAGGEPQGLVLPMPGLTVKGQPQHAIPGA